MINFKLTNEELIQYLASITVQQLQFSLLTLEQKKELPPDSIFLMKAINKVYKSLLKSANKQLGHETVNLIIQNCTEAVNQLNKA